MEHVDTININFILDPKTTHSACDLIWSVPWYQQGQNLAAKKSLHSRKKMGGIAAWVVVTSTSLTACLPGNLVGYHHLRKWSYWNLFIGRNVAGTVCVYFSKAVLAVGNIIIKQHALLWNWSLNGETMMKSNSWMISFNVYVWSLKMYRSSSLKSEHVWKVPNTACFKDRLHLQYLSRFFQVIEKPTMENHTWDLCLLVFTFPSISSKPKESYFCSCWQLFCSTWTMKN